MTDLSESKLGSEYSRTCPAHKLVVPRHPFDLKCIVILQAVSNVAAVSQRQCSEESLFLHEIQYKTGSVEKFQTFTEILSVLRAFIGRHLWYESIINFISFKSIIPIKGTASRRERVTTHLSQHQQGDQRGKP